MGTPTAQDCIVIRGAQENNLRQVSLDIPRGKLVVFTGPSGSGKSSLVFDTIAVESSRQLSETFPLYVRNRLPHHSVPKAEKIDGLTTAIVIGQRPFSGDIRSTVATMTDIAPLLRLLYSRCALPQAGNSNAYSFNDPAGMCPECSGLGWTARFDFDRVLDQTKSLNEGAITFPGHQVHSCFWQLYANSGFFDPDKPLKDYTEQEWNDLLHGTGRTVTIQNTTGKVWGKSYQQTYEGLQDRLERLYLRRDLNALSKANRNIVNKYTIDCACPSCHGARLAEKTLESRLHGLNIYELGEKEISDVIPILEAVDDPVGRETAQRICGTLQAIEDMGLGYLNLNRPSRTLSGGEAQRLRMVRHLQSSLVGLTYIFDEPGSGLHPQDVARLNRLLLRLRDRGNTVLVVEHNKDVIRMADEIVDMGPKAGRNGGQVVFQGSLEKFRKSDTLTAQWLRRRIPVNRQPRQANAWINIRHASLHNLQDVSVDIPRNVLTAVSGLAGSGKSSLVCGELLRQVPEAVHISQAPIGTTSRSNSATYLGIMDEIRKLFAKKNGVSASLFSSNSKGACPACGGRGTISTDMAFMDPVTVTCEVCGGTRFCAEALGYMLRGKNILDVLNMTAEEAEQFFTEPSIRSRLTRMCEVGMGYITLGQPTSTLSGGECQRLKLASHLDARGGVYVLDEPTTGLHGEDIALLMRLLQRLVDSGNTVIVVEHDLDVIRRADWVIDMGPGGGKNGGKVLFSGTPEQLLADSVSVTAECLRRDLRQP